MERAFIVRGGGVRLRSWHYRFNFILIGCWVTVFVLLEVTHASLHGSLCLLANPCNRQVASTLSARTASVPLVGSGGLSSRSCLSMCSSTVSSTRITPRSYSHPHLSVSARHVRGTPFQESVLESQAAHPCHQVYVDFGRISDCNHGKPRDAHHDRGSRLVMSRLMRHRCFRQRRSSILRRFSHFNTIVCCCSQLHPQMTATIRSGDKEAFAAWTINGFHQANTPDSGKSSQTLGSSGRNTDQWPSKIESQMDSTEYELSGHSANGFTTTVKASHTASVPSLNDAVSETGILAPSGIHVSHRIEVA